MVIVDFLGSETYLEENFEDEQDCYKRGFWYLCDLHCVAQAPPKPDLRYTSPWPAMHTRRSSSYSSEIVQDSIFSNQKTVQAHFDLQQALQLIFDSECGDAKAVLNPNITECFWIEKMTNLPANL